MRKYYDIQLDTQNISEKELEGEAIVRAGRYHIAKTLLENDIATVDPLSPENMLIFSADHLLGLASRMPTASVLVAKVPSLAVSKKLTVVAH